MPRLWVYLAPLEKGVGIGPAAAGGGVVGRAGSTRAGGTNGFGIAVMFVPESTEGGVTAEAVAWGAGGGGSSAAALIGAVGTATIFCCSCLGPVNR